LALATRSTAVVADDAMLLRAIDQCVDEVRADDWSIELFVGQLREVLEGAWTKFESDGLSPKISRREYDRLVVDLLDYAVSRFFRPAAQKPSSTATLHITPAPNEPADL
jgi:hypothetical protein